MPRPARRKPETTYRNAKPKEKPYYINDGDCLRMLVRPSGRKVWQYKYRLNGKANVYTMGQYPAFSTKQARSECNTIREMIQSGIDPNQHKKNERLRKLSENANTFEAVAREWYGKQAWAPKHAKNIMNRLEKDVFNLIGWKPVAEVTVHDIMTVLRKIEERGALDVAKRINQYCSAIFDYAIIQGACEMNPAAGRAKYLRAHTPKNRQHLTEKELPKFLEALESDDQNPLLNLSVRLLLLTFVRPGELRGARWEEIDEKKALWTIPADRMKMDREHLVPLSRQALAVIKRIRSLSAESELLFPGRLYINKPISDVALIKTVKRLTNDKATPHGFRHTASTILNEQGFDPHHIERQLAHVDGNKVRGTYNKALYLKDRKKLMQWWGDYLCERGLS